MFHSVITRTVGEPGGIGQLCIEDCQSGLEWQSTIVESKSNPGTFVATREFVCLSADLEPGWGLSGDLSDAARDFVANELCSICGQPTGKQGDETIHHWESGKVMCPACYEKHPEP